MPNQVREAFITRIQEKYGSIRRIGASRSLFDIGNGTARIYVRYSKLHIRGEAFYGFRDKDLRELQGLPSIVCLLWDGQQEPLLIPFADYEEVFQSIVPAEDGQYKALVFQQDGGVELYIAQAGRFRVDDYIGWHNLDRIMKPSDDSLAPELSHSQIQTLLGAIGHSKGHSIWIPQYDRQKLDWSLTNHFYCLDAFPKRFTLIERIMKEVDVIWFRRGSSDLEAIFEIEHSTPIYSGLLRLNDVFLVTESRKTRFGIVANETRRSLFSNQLHRPTFQASGLSNLCIFLDYYNTYAWYRRTFQ